MSVPWNFFGVNEIDKTPAICNLCNGSICTKFQHDNDVIDRIGELRHHTDLTNCSKCKISSDLISGQPSCVCPEHIQKHKLELSKGLKVTTWPVAAQHTSIGSPAGSCFFIGLADCSRADNRPSTTKPLLIWSIRLHPVSTIFSFLPLIFLLHPSLSMAYFFLTC